MEYMPGGDCFSVLQSFGFLDEPVARWFIAEALLGLEYLHDHTIVHRDIKPQNMLITAMGHLKLADFGLSAADSYDESDADASPAKVLARLKHSAVGTPDYLAPEILRGCGYSFTVDFWALGICLYQFLAGEPPFAAESVDEVYERILKNELEIDPDELSGEGRSIIQALLISDAEHRLGSTGVEAIKKHPFFAGNIDFSLELHKCDSPFKPTLKHAEDTSNFAMNARAKVDAHRMRQQLEDDHSDTDQKGAHSGERNDDAEPEEELSGEEEGSFHTINVTQVALEQLAEVDGAGSDSEGGPRALFGRHAAPAGR